jgi:hypothetical protein
MGVLLPVSEHVIPEAAAANSALFRRIAAAAAVAALAGPALAEEMTMSRAIEAASLHEGPLDMVAYYEPARDGALEVTATFAPREAEAASMRVVMALRNGDDVAFGLPGYPQVLYRFVRTGQDVTVSAEVRPAGLEASAAPGLAH